MTHVDLPKFPVRHGYMSERIQQAYIKAAVEKGLLPRDAHRMAGVVSLTAPPSVSSTHDKPSTNIPSIAIVRPQLRPRDAQRHCGKIPVPPVRQ